MSDTENGVVDKKENFERSSNGPSTAGGRRSKCPWCHETFSKNTAGTVALLQHKKTQGGNSVEKLLSLNFGNLICLVFTN